LLLRKISDEDAKKVTLWPEDSGHLSLSIDQERDAVMLKVLRSGWEIPEPSLEHLADDDTTGRIAVNEQPSLPPVEG
jgi:hypothetical protein